MSRNSGSPSLKNLGPKTCKNLGRFYTTSDFNREYLRNQTRYPKSERFMIESDSSRVQGNKSGELWFTIHKVVHVSSDPPKSTFLGNYISAPRGCWPLKFLQTLDTGQGLLDVLSCSFKSNQIYLTKGPQGHLHCNTSNIQ